MGGVGWAVCHLNLFVRMNEKVKGLEERELTVGAHEVTV